MCTLLTNSMYRVAGTQKKLTNTGNRELKRGAPKAFPTGYPSVRGFHACLSRVLSSSLTCTAMPPSYGCRMGAKHFLRYPLIGSSNRLGKLLNIGWRPTALGYIL